MFLGLAGHEELGVAPHIVEERVMGKDRPEEVSGHGGVGKDEHPTPSTESEPMQTQSENLGDHEVPTDLNGSTWSRIRAKFEAGSISIREISRRYGVSDTAIRKRAVKEKWDASSRTTDQPANTPTQTDMPTAPTIKSEEDAVVRTNQICDAGDNRKFKWEPENEDVLTPAQQALAVYINAWNQIVIRQEAYWNENDDSYVFIGAQHVPALIKKLQELVSLISAGAA
jgi:hypothetical protein